MKNPSAFPNRAVLVDAFGAFNSAHKSAFEFQGGMSLRDYLAAAALPFACQMQLAQIAALGKELPARIEDDDELNGAINEGIAAMAYGIADACLKESAKREAAV